MALSPFSFSTQGGTSAERAKFIASKIPKGPQSMASGSDRQTRLPQDTNTSGATTPAPAVPKPATNMGTGGAVSGATGPAAFNPNYQAGVDMFKSAPQGTPAPTGVTPAAPAANNSYRDAYMRYLKSLEMGQDEIASQDSLNRLLTQSAKDQETALERGESLGFATGEAARVNRNNQFMIDAASRGVSALASKRTAASDAAKVGLDFERDMIDMNKPVTVGKGETQYRFNPETGQYDTLQGAPGDRDTQITEVNGRRVLVDTQTGEVISDIGNTGSGAGGSTTTKLSADDRRALLAANFTDAEITQVESDVRTYGFETATEGMSAGQKDAIRRALGGSSAVQSTPFLNRDFLTTAFSQASVADMLKAMGKEASAYKSIFKSRTTEEANIKKDFEAYLDSLVPLIEQYRAAGYDDKEILKMMQ